MPFEPNSITISLYRKIKHYSSNNSYKALRATLSTSCSRIANKTLWKKAFNPHFANEETEAQRGSVTGPNSWVSIKNKGRNVGPQHSVLSCRFFSCSGFENTSTTTEEEYAQFTYGTICVAFHRKSFWLPTHILYAWILVPARKLWLFENLRLSCYL